jgi:hypothetical protein
MEEELTTLFRTEFPEVPDSQKNFDKPDALNEFKKWFDFWHSNMPQELKTPHIDPRSNVIQLAFIKQRVCENRILGIFEVLKQLGWLEDFNQKYMSQPPTRQ